MYRPLTCIALLFMLSGIAGAAIYSWKDDRGEISYTDDPSSIPLKYRKSARIVEGDADRPQADNEEKPVPEVRKEEAPAASPAARIEGKTFLGRSGEFGYYFDRTRVLLSGKGATLQYSLATLEVDEKGGTQRSGSLHIWCATGRVNMETVNLPEEHVQSLKERFCSQPADGGAK